jgi:hypothetical protein
VRIGLTSGGTARFSLFIAGIVGAPVSTDHKFGIRIHISGRQSVTRGRAGLGVSSTVLFILPALARPIFTCRSADRNR